MDFFFLIFQEIISLSFVLRLFINVNGSKHDRQTKLTYFMLLIYTRITSARDEFLGTFENMNY